MGSVFPANNVHEAHVGANPCAGSYQRFQSRYQENFRAECVSGHAVASSVGILLAKAIFSVPS